MVRTIVAVLLLLTFAGPALAGDPAAPDGRAVYLRYCGACHGPQGKGDGVAGTFMRPKPIDLTLLAKSNGGTFPFLQTMERIDGRTSVRAHGDPDMPVWGEIFAEQSTWDAARRSHVRGTLMAITDYIQSIQER